MLSQGFLGRPSTFGGDLNLLIQLGLGVLLLVGLVLARRTRYTLHGTCQSVALVGALVMTAIWMLPSFHANYGAVIFRLGNRVNAAAAAHVATGTAALLLGIYVVLVAATPLVPAPLRFRNYRVWMRTLISLWWLALLLGVLTYWLSTS
jgi:uncharacterized protein YacL